MPAQHRRRDRGDDPAYDNRQSDPDDPAPTGYDIPVSAAAASFSLDLRLFNPVDYRCRIRFGIRIRDLA